MRQFVVATMVAAFSGGLAMIACGSDGTGDGRPDNPSFDHPGSSGSGGTSGSSGASGSSGGTADGGAAGVGTVYCTGTFGAVVASYDSCCKESDKQTIEYGFGYGFLKAFGQACSAVIDSSLSKGRVVHHPDQAQACAAEFAQDFGPGKCAGLAAASGTLTTAACTSAFTGVQAAGAACLFDYECKDGLTCIGASKEGDGTCQAPPAIGASCGAKSIDGGSTSSFTLPFGTHPSCADGATCKNGTCVAAAAAGATCFSDGDCAPLKCRVDKCSSAGPTGAGTPCRAPSDCMAGLYCELGDSTTIGSCTAKTANGAACTIGRGSCQGRCDGDAGTCASFCGSP